MTRAEHFSSFELDLYFAEREPRADVEQHVAACTRCSAYLAELALLHEAAEPPRAVHLPPRVVSVAARSTRAFGPRWALGAAAAVLVVAVGHAVSRQPGDAAYVAVKGSPAVQLLLHRSGHTRPWDGTSAVFAGDALALRVACERFVHVSVVAAPSPGQPAPVRLSDAECPSDPTQALPFTLLVDDEPGQERFSVVFSQTPLSDAELAAALRAGARSTDVWVTPFELDKGDAR